MKGAEQPLWVVSGDLIARYDLRGWGGEGGWKADGGEVHGHDRTRASELDRGLADDIRTTSRNYWVDG